MTADKLSDISAVTDRHNRFVEAVEKLRLDLSTLTTSARDRTAIIADIGSIEFRLSELSRLMREIG